MLVTQLSLKQSLEEIRREDFIALDTEATGLAWYKGDRLFSISIATADKEYYFDFLKELDREIIPNMLEGFGGTVFMHNAKFDMHMLDKEGMDFKDTKIICTMILARLTKNNRINLSLDTLAKEVGYEKLDTVKKFCMENKLWEWRSTPGKKKREKHFFFNKVPLWIILTYAERDARATYALGIHFLKEMKRIDLDNNNDRKLRMVLDQEVALTKVLFEMEKIGIKIDRNFTKKAYLFEANKASEQCDIWQEITGSEFIDSGKELAKVFDERGLKYPKTEKGNPCFKEEHLKDMDNILAQTILKYRKAYKSAYTYYSNFLHYADKEGVIHANTNPTGTDTGRFSYREPNLQNLTKIERGDSRYRNQYLVRRCFVPRQDYKYYMFDYDQMEYRLMLDYAKELPVIEEVLAGKDVHQATADMMGVDRSSAKTLNFMLLYGGGVQKLADALGISYEKAADLKCDYFSALPGVQGLINNICATAKRRHIFNWIGRRYSFDRDFCYKAPNFLIQGGCADIIKKAMLDVDFLLSKHKSRILVQVHDELLVEIHKEEEYLVPYIKQAMEQAYDYKLLPLTVGVECSDDSWQDKRNL